MRPCVVSVDRLYTEYPQTSGAIYLCCSTEHVGRVTFNNLSERDSKATHMFMCSSQWEYLQDVTQKFEIDGQTARLGMLLQLWVNGKYHVGTIRSMFLSKSGDVAIYELDMVTSTWRRCSKMAVVLVAHSPDNTQSWIARCL